MSRIKLPTLKAFLLLAALLSCPSGDVAQAQMPARAPVKVGLGSGQIAGAIVAGDSGARLGRARVRLTAIATKQSVTQVADTQGHYEFRDLAPGRYSLIAMKGGFVQTSYGQARAFSPGTPIELADGARLTNMNIRLPPGATLDGRVFDETGEPLVDAIVMTLRGQYAAGQKRLVTVGRVLTTNERGEFHLFGLPPGNYYLSATVMTNQNVADASARDGYAPTYYPGTVDLAAAEPIFLSESEQLGGLDIVLAAVKTASLSGVARDSEGRPFGSGGVTVINATGGFPIPVAGALIGPDGSFKISNVPPGRFTLNAASTVSPGSTATREVATQTVAVAGDDLTGIILSSPKPAALGGMVDREKGDTDNLPPGVQIRVVAANPAEDLTDLGTVVRTNRDGTFQSIVRPGVLRVELAGAAPGWYLSRVLSGERDVTDSGIELRPNGELSDVRVLLTKQVSVISGVAKDETQRPVRDYAVSIFSRDETQWGFRSRRVAAAKADQDGRFVIRGLPQGDYFISAVDYMEQGESQDPEFLTWLRENAQPIKLGATEAKNINLSLRRR